jgi:hypothetical protein
MSASRHTGQLELVVQPIASISSSRLLYMPRTSGYTLLAVPPMNVPLPLTCAPVMFSRP